MTKRTDPSVTQQVKFDAICMQFEQAWRQNEKPAIEAFLENSSAAERSLLLPQLLLLEIEYIEQGGTPPEMDAYLSRFPDEHPVVHRAFEEHVAALAASSAENRRLDGTIDQQPIAERPGSQIGRYKLLEQIGEGGMGVVYMAEQQRPVRRKVALKIIKPGMDTKQVVARFEAERQALAVMDHPNIARVLDAGSTDSGRPYFVMELVRGTTITEYCDQAKLDTNERLKLFKLVCQAVQHAHTKGIIHRDIKPSNVLVTLHDGEPVPKIIDFGVSKAMGQQLTDKTMFTAFAQMVGTPLYMSPEQAEMSGLDIDTRSDIYSLGVLLYELLTGVTPFDRKRLHTAAFDELRRIIREEEPEKPSTRVSSLGDSSVSVSAQRATDPARLKQLLRGELDWIVMKTLEKDRNRRYETANALVAEVRRYLSGDPVEACPPSATYRLRKLARRYKSQVAVAGGFAVLLLASSVIAWALYADARRARNEAIAAKEEVTVERDRAITAEKSASSERDRAELERDRADRHAGELKKRLYAYNLVRAEAAYEENNTRAVLDFLNDCLEEQRGWEWHRLHRLVTNTVAREYRLPESQIVGFGLSPDGRHLAIADTAGKVHMLDASSGEELWVQAPGERYVLGRMFSPRFSPDGKSVAVMHASHDILEDFEAMTAPGLRGGLKLWDTVSGRTLWDLTIDNGVFGGQIAFSPTGRRLAVGVLLTEQKPSLAVQLRDVKSSQLIWSAPVSGLPVSLCFSPDEQNLFLSIWSDNSPSNPSTLACWTVADHQEKWSVGRSVSSYFALNEDGTQLVTSGHDHSLQIWDAASGAKLDELPGNQTGFAMAVCFNHDGTRLLSRGAEGGELWDWENRQVLRSVPEAAYGATGPPTPIEFSPGDEFFATQDTVPASSIQFHDVEPLSTVLPLSGHQKTVKVVAFSPQGTGIGSVSVDGTFRTWNQLSGQEQNARVVDRRAFALDYSPDGTYVATGGDDGAKLWETESGRLVHHWPSDSSVYWIAFSDDGLRLAGGGWARELLVWDVASGDTLLSHPTTTGVDGLAWCTNGEEIAFMDTWAGRVKLLSLKTGKSRTIRETELTGHEARCITRDPQGNTIAVGLRDRIELWDLDPGRKRHTLAQGGDTHPGSLTFNADGSRLFSGDTQGVVKVWDVESGSLLFSMQAHEERIDSLDISRDGKTLATGAADGLVKLWETTRPSLELKQQRQFVAQATKAVQQEFVRTLSRRAVFESLSANKSLDPATLKVALDIANARGDMIDAERNHLMDAIEAAAGIDLEDPDSVPTEPYYRWYWSAYHLAHPTNSPVPIERQIRLLKQDDLYSKAHQLAYVAGLSNARLGRWPETDADFVQALSLVPEKTGFWLIYAYRQVFLLAHTDQWDRYDQLCQKTLADFGNDKVSENLERAAKMCLFSKHVDGVLEQAGRLADLAYERGTDYAPHLAGFAFTKGIADLRRDKFDSALEMFAIASNGYRENKEEPPPMLPLYAAIAHARLDQHDKAKESLQIGVSRMEAELPGTDAVSFSNFSDWMITQIVRREAEEVIHQEAVREADSLVNPDKAATSD